MAARPVSPAPLPPQPTTFVGREAEVAALTRLLAEPDCRLVTIVGPGGIGKTRLALQVAARAAPAYADGVAFAPLQDVPTAELLVGALAEAVGCPLSGRDEPQDQLLAYLRDRELLLLLDNAEHLLDGAEFVGELLAAAPRLQLLVTSREALNLQEEWRYPLAGLEVPAVGQGRGVEACSAVALFVERARRVRRDFALEAEREGVVRICRLVGGLPLALELAAAWARTLPCAAIAEEIAGNLALLATSARNVPERHRSVRAAFDQSWQHLSWEERAVYARLAVFHGGFRRAAAERVAGATLPVLATLLDKSLVRYEADGRYHLHELLGEYAAEQLAASPGEVGRGGGQPGAYYVGDRKSTRLNS